MQRPRMCDIELRGLDGGNLLAYLAALGTLRVLTAIKGDAEVRMSWVDRGCWIPVIHHSGTPTTEELLSVLEQRVCGPATINATWEFAKDLTLNLAEFGDHMQKTASDAHPWQRENADFLAALGSDVYGAGTKKETMSDTDFRTMSGAGHQHFLGFMKELAITTDAA